jgi:hypothetical protein
MNKISILGGCQSPRQVLLDALNECDDLEFATVIGVNKEGFVSEGHSESESLERLGALVVAIAYNLIKMRETAGEQET